MPISDPTEQWCSDTLTWGDLAAPKAASPLAVVSRVSSCWRQQKPLVSHHRQKHRLPQAWALTWASTQLVSQDPGKLNYSLISQTWRLSQSLTFWDWHRSQEGKSAKLPAVPANFVLDCASKRAASGRVFHFFTTCNYQRKRPGGLLLGDLTNPSGETVCSLFEKSQTLQFSLFG